MERKLATIRRISDLISIEGADRIEVAVVDGWKVVVKKGEYQVGQIACYLEIDSWVPHSVAPFLTKSGHYPKVYKGVEGQRLKTVKLKGQISQGLLLPTYTIPQSTEIFVIKDKDGVPIPVLEGDDVSELLGVIKWEQEIPAQLSGLMRGSFPSDIRKTDQDRIQNCSKRLNELQLHAYEVTEKLHGCSATFYLDRHGVFHVCSRNIDLQQTVGNTYWDIAIKYDIENKMKEAEAYGVAIQGEIVGPGINGNQYGLTEADFYVFDLFNSINQTYCDSFNRIAITYAWGLKHVPVIDSCFEPDNMTIESILSMAEGVSKLNSSQREGLVFKAIDDPEGTSFKAVSNSWLVSGGE